ncbi:hypothetical protein B0H14DRAFT_3169299 [Mycena olivaceomarginata]|nr:hypothetical protein B0H14DRAFT_3169299 [Mycena olivaceomarginata]
MATASRQAVSVWDIEEVSSPPKSSVYTHGMLSASSKITIGYRSLGWFAAVFSVVLPPLLVTLFTILSPVAHAFINTLELSPQQHDSIPAALIVLNGYSLLFSLIAAIPLRELSLSPVALLAHASTPLQSAAPSAGTQASSSGPSNGRPQRKKNPLMAAYLEAEAQDSGDDGTAPDGQPTRKDKRKRHPQNRQNTETSKRRGKKKANNSGRGSNAEETGDEQDGSFAGGDSGGSSSDSSDNEVEILNSEASLSLPKTIPALAGGHLPKRKPPKKKHRSDSIPGPSSSSMPVDQPASPSTSQFQPSSSSMPVDQPASTSTSQFQPPKKSRGGTTNPVYLFYEKVELNAEGNPGGEGDKHYKCYHGDRDTLTITKAMKSSLNGEWLHFE